MTDLVLTVELDGSISRVAGGPLEEPIDTGPTHRPTEKDSRNADFRAGYRAGQAEAAAATLDATRTPAEPLDVERLASLVCSLCLFVGESEDPRPITILNGNLVCEPHNGYFQGGDNVQAIIAWKREEEAKR